MSNTIKVTTAKIELVKKLYAEKRYTLEEIGAIVKLSYFTVSCIKNGWYNTGKMVRPVKEKKKRGMLKAENFKIP